MPSAEPALQAAGLERRFGALRVLRGVDLAVAPGELLLVGGANGAGKSTLLRLLAGLMRPSAGTVTVGGGSPRTDPAVRGTIGLLSHQTLLYDDLTPRENLAFAARLYGLPGPEAVATRWLEVMGIAGRGDDVVARLSRGTVQRVAIARALLHEPRVLLLDEPFTGLDGVAADRVRAVLRDAMARGVALVMVTHNLSEAWALARRVAVLAQGRWGLEEPVAGPLDAFLPRYQATIDG